MAASVEAPSSEMTAVRTSAALEISSDPAEMHRPDIEAIVAPPEILGSGITSKVRLCWARSSGVRER